MNEVDEESKQVSYPVIRDDNGNDKLDFPALGKQFAAEEISAQLNLYLVLLPLDGQSVPKLEKPYHSCLPTLSIRHLCQFVALQLSRQPKEVEIYIRKSKDACLSANYTRKYETKPEQPNGLERLWEENSLSDLYPSLATCQRRSGPCYSIGPLCSGSGISTERHYLLPSHFRVCLVCALSFLLIWPCRYPMVSMK
ncbi:Putative E3 ubiquitin-protein ligase RING1a [Zea mays]|uniref:Putative E3 ubiquitin-protein ligase RING1a n=1 Tax=Zea mays TaxID=4577 RepID=A0A1D6EP09_MAIZE|nr:Putative E3 ubiquitin-protein ligase RING1a [Zea mays]